MKEIKTFLIVDLIVLAIKLLGGLLCKSNVMLVSCLYDLIAIIMILLVWKSKNNSKLKGVLSLLLGILIIASGIGISIYSIFSELVKPSLFIILFIIIALLVKYAATCFYTNTNYQKRKGILTFGNSNSNFDFYVYGIVLVSLILCKISKWVSILKYADILGVILVALFVVYKGFKVVINSIKYLCDKEIEISEEYKSEITKRSEVKRLDNIKYNSFGGIRYVILDVQLKESLQMIDLNTFMVTLQDYLLKISDIACVVMSNKIGTKWEKINNARDSRSRNSQTNTKRKDSKKKNKKR